MKITKKVFNNPTYRWFNFFHSFNLIQMIRRLKEKLFRGKDPHQQVFTFSHPTFTFAFLFTIIFSYILKELGLVKNIFKP